MHMQTHEGAHDFFYRLFQLAKPFGVQQ